MQNIIKVNHLEKNEIKKVFVFSGNINVDKSYPWNIEQSNSVFSDNELRVIKSQNIPVEIYKSYLHGDDPIETVKNKIIKETELQISTKEIYLFGIQKQHIEPFTIYRQLSQNESLNITYNSICEFLLNIVPGDCNTDNIENKCDANIEEKDNYDTYDIENLPVPWDKGIDLCIPIGENLNYKNNVIFTANPYNCTSINSFIKTNIKTILSTNNTNLLFEYFPICNNTLFLCTAEDTILYSDTIDNVSQTDFINLYFPNLYNKNNITNIQELYDKKDDLYKEQIENIDKTFINYNDKIDLFYNVFYEQNNIKYIENKTGISKIDFIIHPKYKINLDLETIFKLVNSSLNIPLIKYNPGKSSENIYRLFTNNNISKNGKKIPYLFTNNNNNNKKGKIINISKLIGRKKRVAFYIEYRYNDINYAINCEFENNGNIHIFITLDGFTNIETIEEVIIESINKPLLTTIKHFIQESGYTFHEFTSFNNKSIEIKNIVQNFEINNNSIIDFKKLDNCIPNVLTLIDKKDAVTNFKYKRVSNYNEMNAIEAFITKLRKSDESSEYIIKKLVENFSNLTHNTASEQYYKWASQVNVAENLFSNKRISIITNTGFNVVFQNTDSLIIKISDINDIKYLKHLTVYITSLLTLLLTKDLSPDIKKICKKKSTDIVIEKKLQQTEINLQKSKTDIKKFLSDFDDIVSDSTDNDSDDNDSEILDLGDINIDDLESNNSKEKSTDDISLSEKQLDSFSSPESHNDGDFLNLDDMELNEKSETSKKKEEDNDFKDDSDDESSNLDFEIGLINKDVESKSKPKSLDISQKLSSKSDEDKQESKSDELETKKPDSAKSESIKKSDVIDIKKIDLKGQNNIFSKKREELEPTIFLKKNIGNFNAYSKSCPANVSKQPVILTDQEKEYIDNKDRDYGIKSYDEHITYGSNEDKKYHYICPRFWCLKDENNKQRPITLKEINEGGCGGWDALIPDKSKKVPPGKRIYEFTDLKYHKGGIKTNNIFVYKPHYPSYLDKDKHPSGLCMPCCFGKPTTVNSDEWEEKQDKSGKKYYYNKKTEETTTTIPDIYYDYNYYSSGKGSVDGKGPFYERDKDNNIILDSVKGDKLKREKPAQKRLNIDKQCNQVNRNPDTQTVKKTTIKGDEAPLLEAWPLKIGQLGYLPMILQRFLAYDCNKICQESLTNNSLKLQQPCLLHTGIEKNNNQSFLACIANIFPVASNYIQDKTETTIKTSPQISISDLKKYIIKKLTIDGFILLQNGELINKFYNPNDDPDIELFKNTKLSKKLTGKPISDNYKKRIISAFTNFKNYINDPEQIIDYSYLWDLICLPSNISPCSLFKDGVNLIIFNNPDNDITSKIEVICPDNYYSKNVFDSKVRTMMLYCKNGYYEPIYSYTKIDKKIYKIQKLFDINEISNDLPEVGSIIVGIWKDLSQRCKPLPSMPNSYNKVYNFKENIHFKNLISILNRINSNYLFKKQILNYSHKVIGIIASNKNNDDDYIYIPCKPSGYDISLDYDYIHSPEFINNYKNTVDKLNYIKKVSKNEILCKPTHIYINDGIIIGVNTETNQFIPVVPEVFDAVQKDNLKPIIINNSESKKNYLDIDTDIAMNSNSYDIERTKFIKQINLETHFYNTFRNIAKNIINNTKNLNVKNKLKNIISNINITYYEKLEIIIDIIKNLLNDYIEFSEYEINTLLKIKKIEMCLNLSSDNCDSPTCSLTTMGDKDICKIIIPKTNLVSNDDNSQQYFIKLANELINYEKLRDFIFEQDSFLTLQNINFKLNDDEILLFESTLIGSYFNNIKPMIVNPYVNRKNSWYTSSPNDGYKYKQVFDFDNLKKSKGINECININNYNFGNNWKKHFEDYELITFKNSIVCTWEIFNEILKQYLLDDTHTIKKLLETLISIYKNIFEKNYDKNLIKKLFTLQGKSSFIKSLYNGSDIEKLITFNDYFLTELDFLVLSQYYKLPLILICNTNIPHTASKNISFIKNPEKAEYCFIIYGNNYSNRRSNPTIPPTYGYIIKRGSSSLSIDELTNKLYEKLVDVNLLTIKDYYERITIGKLAPNIQGILPDKIESYDESKLPVITTRKSEKPLPEIQEESKSVADSKPKKRMIFKRKKTSVLNPKSVVSDVKPDKPESSVTSNATKLPQPSEKSVSPIASVSPISLQTSQSLKNPLPDAKSTSTSAAKPNIPIIQTVAPSNIIKPPSVKKKTLPSNKLKFFRNLRKQAKTMKKRSPIKLPANFFKKRAKTKKLKTVILE